MSYLTHQLFLLLFTSRTLNIEHSIKNPYRDISFTPTNSKQIYCLKKCNQYFQNHKKKEIKSSKVFLRMYY